MIRRLLTRILIVILIAFCGYNWVQMRRLQAQVADLQARLSARSPSAAVPADGADGIERAESRMRRAQADLARSDWLGAQRELRLGMNDLKEGAGTALSSPEPLRRLRELQARMEQLRRQADALRQKAAVIARRHSL